MTETKKRTPRTPEQIIADLEAKIERVKRRAQRRKAKQNPTLRHVASAVHSIDRALCSTQDAATRTALSEARIGLSAVLTLHGVVLPAQGKARGSAINGSVAVEPKEVAAYLTEHPGSSAEGIAAGLGTDTGGVRLALTRLKARGEVKVRGKGRATRYHMASA